MRLEFGVTKLAPRQKVETRQHEIYDAYERLGRGVREIRDLEIQPLSPSLCIFAMTAQGRREIWEWLHKILEGLSRRRHRDHLS